MFFPIRKNTFAPKEVLANIFSAKICSTCEIIHTNITCKMLVSFLRKRLFCSLTKFEGHVSSGASKRYFAAEPPLFFYRDFAVLRLRRATYAVKTTAFVCAKIPPAKTRLFHTRTSFNSNYLDFLSLAKSTMLLKSKKMVSTK